MSMSIIDRVIAAVGPPVTAESRAKARADAQGSASAGDWLSVILQHHREIEVCFDAVSEASDASARLGALEQLSALMTGHAIAEEAAIYPALSQAGAEAHATRAYAEQSTAKLQMAVLENLPPMSYEFLHQLGQVREAVANHFYEEEGFWFLELKSKLPLAAQDRITRRYYEQFTRYMHGDE